MKWKNAKEILSCDPWLRSVITYSQTGNGQTVDDRGLESIVECNVTHIMFRGTEVNLTINSRPQFKTVKISSAPPFGLPEDQGAGLDIYDDHLSYEIGYFLVVQAYDPEELIVRSLHVTPLRFEDTRTEKSIRWGAVEINGRLARPHKWIAIVRNIQIISQGEYLMNGYDVFKCSPGFTPYRAGWHRTGYQRVALPQK
jgi:hypothetical protein